MQNLIFGSKGCCSIDKYVLQQWCAGGALRRIQNLFGGGGGRIMVSLGKPWGLVPSSSEQPEGAGNCRQGPTTVSNQPWPPTHPPSFSPQRESRALLVIEHRTATAGAVCPTQQKKFCAAFPKAGPPTPKKLRALRALCGETTPASRNCSKLKGSAFFARLGTDLQRRNQSGPASAVARGTQNPLLVTVQTQGFTAAKTPSS